MNPWTLHIETGISVPWTIYRYCKLSPVVHRDDHDTMHASYTLYPGEPVRASERGKRKVVTWKF
jgi:hypothetical protein